MPVALDYTIARPFDRLMGMGWAALSASTAFSHSAYKASLSSLVGRIAASASAWRECARRGPWRGRKWAA